MNRNETEKSRKPQMAYDRAIGSGTEPSVSAFSVADLHSAANEGNYLIITTEDLANAFEQLLLKRSESFKVKLVTKEQIVKEFSQASEEISIYSFLRYALLTWTVPPYYVILGGNIDKVPTYFHTISGVTMASDYCYANMDEDMNPEIIVSRFPASTLSDMEKLCRVAVEYDNRQKSAYKDVLLVAEGTKHEQDKEKIYELLKPAFNPERLYASQTDKASVVREIESGAGFISYRGDGSIGFWHAFNGLDCTDVEQLEKAEIPSHIFSITGFTGKIDSRDSNGYNCLGIKWMIEEKACSFIGASQSSYSLVNDRFEQCLWEAIMTEKARTIGEAFKSATAQLYLDEPTEETKANIYMYLLLGDPSLSCSLPDVEKTSAVVLMLDHSATMRTAIGAVRVDAAAFIEEARAGDQFAINKFSNNAQWVYPQTASPSLVTVTEERKEVKEAVQAIGQIEVENMTNMGEAIRLGNQVIGQASTDVKAFVLLSDGEYNKGPNPVEELKAEPPIFVAGLGPFLRKEYFDPLLDKNLNSRYYHEYHSYEMGQIFNEIRAMSPQTKPLENKMRICSNLGYFIEYANVSKESGTVQLAVVWSDERFRYVEKYPLGFDICVTLIAPDGKRTAHTPQIRGKGYCIFNLEDAQPGKWGVAIEYDVASTGLKTISCTFGAFQFNVHTGIDISLPNTWDSGNPLDLCVNMFHGNNPIENMKVDVEITSPLMSLDDALAKYDAQLRCMDDTDSDSLLRLRKLRETKLMESGEDILGVRKKLETACFSNMDGYYHLPFFDTKIAGSYSFRVRCSGTNPVTGELVSMTTSRAVLIG